MLCRSGEAARAAHVDLAALAKLLKKAGKDGLPAERAQRMEKEEGELKMQMQLPVTVARQLRTLG